MLNYFSKKFDLSIYENKIKLLDSFIEIVKKCNERVEYENYLNSLIYLTNLSFEAIDDYFRKRVRFAFETPTKITPSNNETIKPKVLKNKETKFDKIQKMLIKFALINKKTIDDIDSYTEDENLFTNKVYNEIYEEICSYYKENEVEDISKDNFISFVNSDCENKDLLEGIIKSTNDIYKMRIYDSYSEEIIKDLIENLNIEKTIHKNSELRKNLVKNANSENDKFYLNAIINVKKNENQLNKEVLKDEKK